MVEKIYGIDLDEEVTPLKVRDAIVNCFLEAHCTDTGIPADDKEANREYSRLIVKKAFSEFEGEFDRPSKESILKALEKLAEFSKNFRDPSIIEKHYSEIMKLVDKLK